MSTPAGSSSSAPPRAEQLHLERLDEVYRRRDRVFARLMVVQLAFALLLALTYSPSSWQGRLQSTHLHVWYALVFGALLSIPPILCAWRRPGSALTRHVVAFSQMMWSALLIHLTGGRIETHFHVFGSLAFLSYYRDWRVLLTATLTVAGDHLLRGLMWPESVYGIANPEWWRFLEHAGWVVFEDIVLMLSILEGHVEMRQFATRQAESEAMAQTIELHVAERTHELEASRDQFRELVETTRTVPFELDPREMCFTYVGPQALILLGFPAQEWLAPGFLAARLDATERAEFLTRLAGIADEPLDLECGLQRADGKSVRARFLVSPLCCCDSLAGAARLRGVLLDVTEMRQLESELRQAQKLESVGRLAAGVAHEINTPVQFVSDSVHFVRDAFGDLARVLSSCAALRGIVESGQQVPESVVAVAHAAEEADLEYLLENVPRALERSLEGLGRVTTIVRSMKEFAHPDQKEMAPADLNQAVSNTLVIARNEYKYVADLELHLGELPPVTCLLGEVNQVVLNIVVNAAHAIGDVVKGSEARGRITVTTAVEGENVLISIADTGGGIPDAVRERIYDPFFTTKEVGKGTGQGLAIARTVVVEKHGGELWFVSVAGQGTTFFIRLPISGKPALVECIEP